MPTNVIMPALGLAQDTGKVLRWIKAEGQTVTRGEPLIEVETDKVTVEIEAPASGVLAGVRAKEGDVVPVGQVVAVILAPGESVATPASRRPLASPKARRLAEELGIDLATVTGSGPGGEITANDVLAAKKPQATPAGEPVSNVWRVMAERLTQSWTTAPHFYLQREVRADQLVARRQELRARIPQITHTDLLIVAVAQALRTHPRLNARWEGGRIVPSAEINIGVAVATEDGLVVPVIHTADELSLEAITTTRHDLVTRAQGGRLRPDDIRGGTFTISNLGMYGVDAFQPIVNPPQAAILGVGRIVDHVVAVEGQPVIRPIMTLTLACDHRVVDGARAAQFLETIVELLEGTQKQLEVEQ